MPIGITDHSNGGDDGRGERIAWLCENNWRLPDQLAEFEKWLRSNTDLTPKNYSADIGFGVRPEAMGGGGGLSLESISILQKLGMEVWFSEYPVEAKDDSDDDR
jgi:hypothetical protein